MPRSGKRYKTDAAVETWRETLSQQGNTASPEVEPICTTEDRPTNVEGYSGYEGAACPPQAGSGDMEGGPGDEITTQVTCTAGPNVGQERTSVGPSLPDTDKGVKQKYRESTASSETSRTGVVQKEQVSEAERLERQVTTPRERAVRHGEHEACFEESWLGTFVIL
ncbi:hypothetical protein P691DRAFT_806606 [Macrolepiota fuliginosa MF-IS2]|uniref:Uncharacterized protein n=1 Tax=Macrolepiota fuliginosa MF-IS2 TaxID=1400762 RepID=A0A9P5X684_9AGAR|nr:hypothetical protein P691DRAFT_806606 [Macrolepiota fuliginosa MF-IS2]